MKDDLISRSELIAQLECFKLSLGDVILGFVVDRVIERVQEMPAVDAEEVVRCDECIHYVEPDEGDFLGRCTSGIVAVSHGGEIYPGRGFFCLYGERKGRK